MGFNMQKHTLADGTPLVGHAALSDTMKDIIIDALGALAASIIGYVSLKKNKKWLIPKLTDKKVRELKTVAITETKTPLRTEPVIAENSTPATRNPICKPTCKSRPQLRKPNKSNYETIGFSGCFLLCRVRT